MIKPTPPHIIQCHMRTHCANFGLYEPCNEVTVICNRYDGPVKKVIMKQCKQCDTCANFGSYENCITELVHPQVNCEHYIAEPNL